MTTDILTLLKLRPRGCIALLAEECCRKSVNVPSTADVATEPSPV